jgi:6-phosphogluconolactonase (cycloisomerase 2 family)
MKLQSFSFVLYTMQLVAADTLPSGGTSRLFVSSYESTVSSISLLPGTGSMVLKTIDINRDCGLNPSWLTFDTSQRVIYCLDEGINQSFGTVTALSVSSQGSLSMIGSQKILPGPVNGVFRGNISTLLAVAQYR